LKLFFDYGGCGFDFNSLDMRNRCTRKDEIKRFDFGNRNVVLQMIEILVQFQLRRDRWIIRLPVRPWFRGRLEIDNDEVPVRVLDHQIDVALEERRLQIVWIWNSIDFLAIIHDATGIFRRNAFLQEFF